MTRYFRYLQTLEKKPGRDHHQRTSGSSSTLLEQKRGRRVAALGGESRGLLGTARDWQMRAVMKTRMQFSTEEASTNKRLDVVIWSPSSRQVIIVELTVPWEERMEDAYERKMGKYQELVADCQERGWRVWCFPVEVGTRGFVGQSLWRALRVIGVIGLEKDSS